MEPPLARGMVQEARSVGVSSDVDPRGSCPSNLLFRLDT
jgi:hypothetical protein